MRHYEGSTQESAKCTNGIFAAKTGEVIQKSEQQSRVLQFVPTTRSSLGPAASNMHTTDQGAQGTDTIFGLEYLEKGIAWGKINNLKNTGT